MKENKLTNISIVIFCILLIIATIENYHFGLFIILPLILPVLIGIISIFGFKRKKEKMSTVEKVQFDEADLKIKKVKDRFKAIIVFIFSLYLTSILVFDMVAGIKISEEASQADKVALKNQYYEEFPVCEDAKKYEFYGVSDMIILVYLLFYFVTIGSYITFLLYIKLNKNLDDTERKILLRYYRGYVIRNIISFIYSFTVLTILQFIYSTAYKPIIYLYPEKEEKVKVKFKDKKLLTHTYPKYNDEWNVIASPDGTLIDENNKKYYALYYEAKNNLKIDKNTGFCIKGQDSAKFLEEKLEMLGLNYKEKEEFIVYWLPKLEENKYNYIYFMINQEVNDTMELEITPKPDTLIRVWMVYKPLNKEIEVKPQQLTEAKRNGFTVVEWGGSKI